MTDTREEIMNAARAMVQAHGYNALSFREIAKAVGVKSASIHYHFPSKSDLAAALARRYADDVAGLLAGMLENPGGVSAIMQAYTAIFRQPLLNDNRMCLYGIMAAEHADLPAEVRAEVDRFTTVNVAWLVQVLAPGMPKADASAVERKALAIIAAIEGAQLVARGRNDIAVFDETIAVYRAAGLLP